MATPQMTVLQQYIHSSRYARWLPEKGRRETWDETVDRYVDFFDEHLKGNTKGSITDVKDSIRDAIFNMEVLLWKGKTLLDIIVRSSPWILLALLTKLFIF